MREALFLCIGYALGMTATALLIHAFHGLRELPDEQQEFCPCTIDQETEELERLYAMPSEMPDRARKAGL